MANVVVKMRNKGGQIVSDPELVEVQRGDTVVWMSEEQDLAVSFGADHPFRENKIFHNGDQALIRSDAPLGKHFGCTVTLGGTTQDNVNGVDIRA